MISVLCGHLADHGRSVVGGRKALSDKIGYEILFFIQTADRIDARLTVLDGGIGIFGQIFGGKARPAVAVLVLIINTVEVRAL